MAKCECGKEFSIENVSLKKSMAHLDPVVADIFCPHCKNFKHVVVGGLPLRELQSRSDPIPTMWEHLGEDETQQLKQIALDILDG